MDDEELEESEDPKGLGEADTLPETLSEVIERTGVVEVRSATQVPHQVKLRLRVTNESRWLHMITLILKEEERANWGSHICRQYIIHEGRLVYTWNFIIQSDELDRAVQDVCRIFDLICSNIDMFEDAEDREVKRPKKRARRPAKSNGNAPKRKIGHGDLDEIPLIGVEGRPIPEVAWNQFRSTGRRKGAHPIGGGE